MNVEYLTILILIIGFGLIVYFLTRQPKQGEGMRVMMEWMKSIKDGGDLTRR